MSIRQLLDEEDRALDLGGVAGDDGSLAEQAKYGGAAT